MKLLSVLLLALGLSSFAHAASSVVQPTEESSISTVTIMGYASVRSQDLKVSATVIANYVGTAAGLSEVYITLFDNGPTEGDLANSTTLKLTGYVTEQPTNVSLKRIRSNVYALSMRVTVASMNDETGDFEYTKKNISITITLGQDGAVTSAQ